jgi:hypothetical protein
MQTDELRAELAELAREVDPFPEDLPAIRHRVARRRVAGASIATVLIVGLIAGVIATTRSSDRLRVAGHPKETAVDVLPRVDALVAMPARASDEDLAQVKGILDSADVVEKYAKLRRSDFALLSRAKNNLVGTPNLRSFARAHEDATVLGVGLDRSVANRMRQLTAAVGSAATVKQYSELDEKARYNDVEIFMRLGACDAQIDAVGVAVERDPDIQLFRFISRDDALSEFRKLFADEPALLQHTTAEDLPTSFRLKLRDGVRPSAVAERYQHLAGVQLVITPANPFAHDSTFGSEKAREATCGP